MRSFLLICLFVFTALPVAHAMEPQAIAARLQQRYEQTTTLQANFRQETTIAGLAGRSQSAQGTVILKKPGKLRWDYTTPDKQVLICDGDEVLFYVARQKQMMVSNASQYLKDDLTYTFFMGQGSISDDFVVEAMEEELLDGSSHGLKLTPKQEQGQVQTLYLWLDDDFQITHLRIIDHLQSTNDIRLFQIIRNEPVADALFLFVPPKGTEIILQ